MMMTWPPICHCSLRCALIDSLIVAVHRPMTHRRNRDVVCCRTSDYWQRCPWQPLCQVQSRELRLEGLLAVASGRCSLLGTNVIWLNILAHGPLITYELQAFHIWRQLIMCVRSRCMYISPILNNWQDTASPIKRSTASRVYVHFTWYTVTYMMST